MNYSNPTHPTLFFEFEEILPASERKMEEGCDLCQHCQLIRTLRQRRSIAGRTLTREQAGRSTRTGKKGQV